MQKYFRVVFAFLLQDLNTSSFTVEQDRLVKFKEIQVKRFEVISP